MIPNPIERAEASAEAAFDEISQPDDLFRCYQCDALFHAEKEGGTISPDPYAMPVCGKCHEEAYRKHVESVKMENVALRKEVAILRTGLRRTFEAILTIRDWVRDTRGDDELNAGIEKFCNEMLEAKSQVKL